METSEQCAMNNQCGQWNLEAKVLKDLENEKLIDNEPFIINDHN
jgi:hypothetical protein